MHAADGSGAALSAGWEPWQHEYEHGALLLLPPAPVAEEVNELRRRYDPRSAAICDAHVTLSEPLTAPLTSRQLEELTGVLAGVEPLELHYGPITDMGHPPGVVYAISPVEPFYELRRTVHATSAFDGHLLPRAGRAPHMTVAEFITAERSDELLRELRDVPSGAFRCEAVVLMAPDAGYHFRPVLSLRLGAS